MKMNRIRFLLGQTNLNSKLWSIAMNITNLFMEFFRYLIVGGTAFLIDFSLLYIFKTFVLDEFGIAGIYISTAIGFIGGLIYNYIFSLLYVFETAKKSNKGRNINSFIIFATIGVVGLLITELGMYIGVKILTFNYMIVKIFVAGIVLIWNYGARKKIIF